MRFGAKGRISGVIVEVWWENGELTGPDWAVARIKQEAEAIAGVRLGPVEGPYSTRDYLDTAIGTESLLAEMMGPNKIGLGDDPARPALPEGAIG